ncbi:MULTISPECIES: strawberry notch-like NTP hydrolase domain-containing protein [Novosphingobium]|uniref:Methylase n=2 Tax=Sphingomonadaceae TaxID=41297 RepID=A0A1D8AFX5_9SPHN|nr:strawberry notch family protein [Novosphingobium sp. HR1a]AOR81012.1 methylase [Novosphingobium resinovorum]
MTLPQFEGVQERAQSPKAGRLLVAARQIAAYLGTARSLQRKVLTRIVTESFGRSGAFGEWSMRDAYDALEVAQVLMALDPQTGLVDRDDVDAAFAARADLARHLPTQTYRSERQVDMQQFSTPLGLAWLAACAARIRPGDLVLEPSAGTGMLAACAAGVGASLMLNERDPGRADLLALALCQPVARHDGEFIDDLLEDGRRPDVVLMNPPFARSESRGRDRDAGARHLLSALERLAASGRCVAIMSPAFAEGGTGAKGYQRVATAYQPRWELTIDGRPFASHGTSISIRILVYDKGWRGRTQRAMVSGLEAAQALLHSVPDRLDRSAYVTDGPSPVAALVESISVDAVVPAPSRLVPSLPTRRAGLMAGILGSGAKPIRPPAPSVMPGAGHEPALLGYTALDEPPAAGDPVGIYVPWRLTRIAFAAPQSHPDQLMESMAMSSILLPQATYRPMLPPRAVATLSDAQLETVIYAGQAFERDLPGRFAPNDAGTLLQLHVDGHVYRAGFMVGDGTGVGKGRQISGCILDRWCRGQRRAVWISKSASLLEDARRDWAALGGLPIDVQPLDAFPLSGSITMETGILFLTFATLRSQRDDSHSRLQQILAWLGADFDGLIVFDEAHEMANAAGTVTRFGVEKGSEQGLAGVRLQNLLPRACVLYNSATGATDPANLCYASRLGLWHNSAFETREAFMTAISDGGIAAMEIVARDLKAMGFYTARALTFSGVEYDPLEHQLTTAQIEIYDAYADAWAIIHAELDRVLEATGIVDGMTGRSLNGQAKGSALSRFESTKQRFFAQLLIAMKLPSLIAAIEQDIVEGRQPVVQLVTTSEAALERHLAGLSAAERADLDIEVSPRELMIQYLETAFPTRQMRVFKGEDGEPRSEPMVDEDGRPVHSQAAIRARDELVERLCAMPPIPAALDALVAHFGTDRLAEVTGRSRRIVLDAAGRQRVERRSARSNIAETHAFMSGAKQVLVFSDAGGTGRSYHADRGCATADRRRVHYLLEPGWRAAAAIQGLGRTNRTNQASAPIFRPATTDCKGERRFISTIARRLDSLGALTRGQRQTGGQNLFDPLDNLESDLAREALLQWYRLLARGKLESTSLTQFIAMTGLKLIDKDSGALLDDLPPIQRWLNRLLALRIGTQNAIFEEYLGLIQARIDAARERGTLDLGVETIMVEAIVPIERQLLRRDPQSGAETWLSRIEVHRKRRPTPLSPLLEQWKGSGRITFLRNARSGRIALKVPSWAILGDDGERIEVHELVRPGGSERMRKTRLAESAWEPIDKATFTSAWTAECEELAQRIDVEAINIATGLLLPVWNRLPDDDLRVWRITDAQGASMLGRIISPSGLAKVASAFGLDTSVRPSPAEIFAGAATSGGVFIPALPGASLRYARVADDLRLEIKDFDVARLPRLKALGCFTEIIQFRTRLFVPLDRALEVLTAIEETFGDVAPTPSVQQ